MIAALRRRHRWMVGAVALSVGPLLYAALGSRPDLPSGELPAPLQGPDPATSTTLRPFADQDAAGLEDTDDFEGTTVAVDDGSISIKLTTDLRRPDVLAYWSASAPTGGLPDDAVLLGPVSARRANVLSRPAAARGDGTLIFYSLGHQEVVASAPLRLPSPAPSESTGSPVSTETPVEPEAGGES